MKTTKIIGLLIIAVMMAGCTLPTRYERDPSSPGFGRDAIKKSRCACREIYKNGEWL